MFGSRKFRRFGKIVVAVLVCYILLVHFSFTQKWSDSRDRGNVDKNKFMPEAPSAHILPKEEHVKRQMNKVASIMQTEKPDKLHNGDQNKESRKPLDKQMSPRNLSSQLCPSLYRVKPSDRFDVWYTVATLSGRLHVYSAFLDIRDHKIKVMGVGQGQSKLFCQMWIQEGEEVDLHVTEATWHLIPETHGFRFVPFIIHCPLPDRIAGKAPIQVSLVHKKCADPSHALPVQVRQEPFIPRYNFTVCLTPINRAYARIGEFLEYMEVNGLFGADHFVFYDHHIGEPLMPFIESYKQEDKLTVLQWKIPVETTQGPTNEIHYFGQVLALNDCLFRARLHSRFVVFLDLDEVIVPMRHNSWLDLMSEVSGTKLMSKTFIFPNVFFREEWAVNPTYSKNPLVNKLQLRTLLYTKREHKTWPHRMRSKYISPSNGLYSVGIHFPWQSASQLSDHTVSENDGILFHYRNWEDYSEASFANQTRMFDFAESILNRVRVRLDKAKSFGYKEDI